MIYLSNSFYFGVVIMAMIMKSQVESNVIFICMRIFWIYKFWTIRNNGQIMGKSERKLFCKNKEVVLNFRWLPGSLDDLRSNKCLFLSVLLHFSFHISDSLLLELFQMIKSISRSTKHRDRFKFFNREVLW